MSDNESSSSPARAGRSAPASGKRTVPQPPGTAASGPEHVPYSRSHALIVVVVAGLLLLATSVILYGTSGGFIGKPEVPTAYVCAGKSATVYYRFGGTSIRLVSGGGEVSGRVDVYSQIAWDESAPQRAKIHLTLPTALEDAGAKTLSINGGSFVHVRCAH